MKTLEQYLAEADAIEAQAESRKKIEAELSQIKTIKDLEKWAKKSEFFVGKRLSFTDFGDELWINFIIINPKYRGQGILSILMRKIKELAKANGNKTLNLLTSDEFGISNEKLKAIYSRYGFKPYKEGKSKCENYMKFEL